jgi:hypothetical protein
MTGEPTIDYDALALEAMRGVVRSVLTKTAKSGLPGDHHFYISFDTEQPGVTLSRRLKERYPREMTIVLQHRFWDLNVHDDRFEVKLTFDGIPERLVVPFAAIKVFFDPSVQYGLRFEDGEAADAGDTTGAPAGPAQAGAPRSVTSRSSPKKSKPAGKKNGKTGEPSVVAVGPAPAPPSGGSRPVPLPRPAPALAPVGGAPPAAPGASSERDECGAAAAPHPASEGDAKPANGGAQILSLDQFRKK